MLKFVSTALVMLVTVDLSNLFVQYFTVLFESMALVVTQKSKEKT